MGSLTVRNIGDDIKKRLRLRAVRNGHSMEEEIRHILGAAAFPSPHASRFPQAAPSEPSRVVPSSVSTPPRVEAGPAHGGMRILLVIGGGIAAYKSLDLIRRLRERGSLVRVVMTKAAQEFITPLSVSAIAGGRAYSDLFDSVTEFDIGHIRLARDTDLVVVAPATADLLAKMAGGHADDLASTVLVATDRPVLIAPAMNPHMWAHPATGRNLRQLTADGIAVVGPNAGEMAESGEAGLGRMAEPLEIVAAIEALAHARGDERDGPLSGQRVLVTAGPTHEPMDPVRYIANRSSGKQGYAIAAAAAAAGADVTLVSGPVDLADPSGVTVVKVETARDMLRAVEAALPVDVGIFAAAVADWRVAQAATQKIKKGAGGAPALTFVENPDILATVAAHKAKRPKLVIGFAAETEKVVDHARAKLARKRCDWILANDVSAASGVMGGDNNTIHLVTAKGVEAWPTQTKEEVARMLIARIAATLGSVAP